MQTELMADAAKPKSEPEHVAARPRLTFQKHVTPTLVLLLAAAVVLTITRNWNSWQSGKVEQITDDAVGSKYSSDPSSHDARRS